MTELLEKALQKVSALSQGEQDAIACQILATLEDDETWREALDKNPEKLEVRAQDALREHRRGETRDLDELI